MTPCVCLPLLVAGEQHPGIAPPAVSPSGSAAGVSKQDRCLGGPGDPGGPSHAAVPGW